MSDKQETPGAPPAAAPAPDEAAAMVGDEQHQVDAAVVARAVRKTDWVLMPLMMVGYGLVYYDKAILGSAAILGMSADLSLSVKTPSGAVDTSRLSWATSIFYFGMLAGLYPLTYALQRFDMGRILGLLVIVWAAVCMATAGVSSHSGLYAQRFFLGFVESVIPTGFMCIVAGHYDQAEQSLRQSWWFSSTGLFTVIGGLLNYAFAHVSPDAALQPWQYLYLFAGALTFLFGLACFAVPNSPVSAWFLKPTERFAAVERLRLGQTGVRCKTFKVHQLREAVLDVKVWLVFIMMMTAYVPRLSIVTSHLGLC